MFFDIQSITQDFDLTESIDDETFIIYAWRSGPGLDQHRTSQRGSAMVNLGTGDVRDYCDNSNDFYALHGALILLAWMIVAPYGLYQARYNCGIRYLCGFRCRETCNLCNFSIHAGKSHWA